MDEKYSRSRSALFIVSAIAVLLVLYVAAYFSLVSAELPRIKRSFARRIPLEAHFTSADSTGLSSSSEETLNEFGRSIFAPIHWLDRNLWPGKWELTVKMDSVPDDLLEE